MKAALELCFMLCWSFSNCLYDWPIQKCKNLLTVPKELWIDGLIC